ncbi:MAG: hypothetical protein A2268_15980 [Candidatus Raymondbacteria bacterium RifOxyA12_full_50_37]|uniref:S1 motif domain-containing protein n=1 Tax=Candidatus Raymondbacteria bacterium RIFOXYD12_FULL_49_13 TaxID=1817890 RepID=A0A1F7F5J5_UNCRA|nr:MAG: hypothetical protein A2268_15980 [Candidatus Raymondbacteria bacterium RifOxyA12_full_50_37]OGJ89255.1 MAG: hypothetical protein A2248_18875 [Candidatus Raymondbacteria bacterium RIFOXYA2_FULL_49_16]OGJ97422.1 MAG: hypothetical protein A2453_03795 [Candidatus Raymondbacteria bacterium RIFOXYC2_FULL_50_21]OGK00754.1 MAG: hypothetical protein A2487_08530 [Candidatus Raymondbacteria bacterium RifOxyC12_full_50_8]OGK01935.1 MAG: hypothetical protein A2519_05680 [Candidatus Raymondbacteria b
MEKEIIINVAPHEKRMAILENKKLAEIIIERPEDERLAGNVYKGKITKILPGLQSAFIDIGLEKAAFLSISDVKSGLDFYKDEYGEEEDEEEDVEEAAPTQHNRRPRPEHVKIEKMFKEGQELLVQIIKEPLSTKGAKVTNGISFAGRFLVLVPGTDFIGVSKKTNDRNNRRRLKDLIRKLKPDNTGVIVRTIGLEKNDNEFKAELDALGKKWNLVRKAAEKKKAPALLYTEEDLTSITIRDVFSSQFKRCVVDSAVEYRQITAYLKSTSPELADRVLLYKERQPIFETFEVEKEFEKSLRRKVWLKGGGYLVFDYTEAMVVIDVNTGRNVGRKDAEETILRTNLAAVDEIARQIRLRNLGGMIAIDFIDMRFDRNRQKLMNEFDKLLQQDRAPLKLGAMGEFGVVMLTRKRVRNNLLTSVTEICHNCGGTGRIYSKPTILAQIDRYLHKIKNVLELNSVRLVVNPVFSAYLLENGQKLFNEIRKAVHIDITLEEDSFLPMDNFKIFDMDRVQEFTQLLQNTRE